MQAFALREKVVGEYKGYVGSFLRPQDERIARYIDDAFDSGQLWPDALLQINPAYQPGPTLEELAQQGTITRTTAAFFTRADGGPLRLYQHQLQAIEVAERRQPYLVTTGTGSGKSLTYLIPIYDYIARNLSEIRGVRAIIVYPMNALINSQFKALEEYAERCPGSPVRFSQYTGQESEDERQRILAKQPDILLTNYMMLEYMLLRTRERVFIQPPAASVQFLVLDELHTYRGRQGADVAMLVRRLRERTKNPNLLCIGTSATVATGLTRADRRNAAADAASKLFGVDIRPENVIDESLRRVTQMPPPASSTDLREAVLAPHPAATLEGMVDHPLAAWVETTFGLREEDGRLVRREPISFAAGVKNLAAATGLDEDACAARLQEILTIGNAVKNDSGEPFFAFRLHQFLAVGGTLYATLEPSSERYLTLEGGHYAPDGQRLLYPLAFCRECGQEYYLVHRLQERGSLRPRLPLSRTEDDLDGMEQGYLLVDEEGLWAEDQEAELPDHWFEFRSGVRHLKPTYRRLLPQRLRAAPDGLVSEDGQGVAGWFLRMPFVVCPRCGVSYDIRDKNEFRKLVRLSQAGRSTATTLAVCTAIIGMRDDPDVEITARKILSFTDNRQDASLQAGHFNDFVRVCLVRAALYRAFAESGGLDHASIGRQVFRALDLPVESYAKVPVQHGPGRLRVDRAMQELLEYLIYEDMYRGWRVTQPNLEQCGLLRVTYPGLSELCRDDSLWGGNRVLRDALPEMREHAVTVFLNHLRRQLAIDARLLKPDEQTELKSRAEANLLEEWAFDRRVELTSARFFLLPGTVSVDISERSLGQQSRIGGFLSSPSTWGVSSRLTGQDYRDLLNALVQILRGHYLTTMRSPASGGDAVQLLSGGFAWQRGDGHTLPDPVRTRHMPSRFIEHRNQQANRYFSALYRDMAGLLVGISGREHTAQVKREVRREREDRFKEGTLPVLFCSPTMELGVDIRDLNVVHLRNVPPTPANYAQRSGRAGRGGQPALVVTLCSEGSPHDQYFLRRQDQMVSGAVVPARLDLGNEDLMRAHVQAVWLAEVGAPLGRSNGEVIDLDAEDLPLRSDVAERIELAPARRVAVVTRCQEVLASCGADLCTAPWYGDDWVQRVVVSAPSSLRLAFDRWRELYRQARHQRDEAHRLLSQYAPDRRARERKERAERDYDEAVRQLRLLLNETDDWSESDFYPYRYLATEGFLPGYNFPRLPVRAFVRHGPDTHVVARHRFLAVTEFGPQNRLYHEGRKYRIGRCILPPGEIQTRLVRAKLCSACGYIHYGDRLGDDNCNHCGAQLDGEQSRYISGLLEMPSVQGWLTERITCDEEERVREGYTVSTHFRFAPGNDGQLNMRHAEVRSPDGQVLARVVQAPQAELWRVNHGWRRSRQQNGFALDATSGRWSSPPDEDTDEVATTREILTDIRPFVRDTRNLLFLQPMLDDMESGQDLDGFLASLGYALQRGIQVAFQVEEHEIAVERIGQGEQRRLLFWEAAEGGTGVWSRLVNDPQALASVAGSALEICHFEPSTGKNLDPGGCSRACYHCLLSYTNQTDHHLLDRTRVVGFLLRLAASALVPTGPGRSRDEQYEWLQEQTHPRSSLERELVELLYRTGRRLPERAQYRPEAGVYAEADFFYGSPGRGVCVFCDGPPHDDPDRQRADAEQRTLLEDLGYRIVLIHYDLDLREQLERHADLFGPGHAGIT